jgi:1-acyl-sn-glycerol-3-phosphate acyltransferase
MEKTIYFPENTYDTPKDTCRAWGDRLAFNSRFWFFLKFLGIVFRCRSYAVKGIYDDVLWAKTSYDVFKLIERTGGRFHIRGIDNLRKSKEPVVIISNHMSSLETVIFPSIIAPLRRVTFVVKEELVKARVFGPVMKSRNPVVVGRKDPRRDLQAVFEDGIRRLQEGTSIVIFPQSTRHVEFDSSKFNSLGVKLAKKAGVKIIPTAIKTDFWGNGKYIKDVGPINRQNSIYMEFGEPMEITANGNQQHAYTIQFIQDRYFKWKEEEQKHQNRS